MSPRAPAGELLRDLAAVLGNRRWYLFGAQAVLIWGRPRLSADVDVTAEIPQREVPGFVDKMRSAGFELRVTDPEEFIRRTRVLPFRHVPTSLPLDLVLAGPGLEEEFLERAVATRIGELEIPVLSPEDLLTTKILAGRPKDLEDVHGILMQRLPNLDLGRIRDTLSRLEAALGQSDLLPAFEAELERARGMRSS